jgi:hypothetical protein
MPEACHIENKDVHDSATALDAEIRRCENIAKRGDPPYLKDVAKALPAVMVAVTRNGSRRDIGAWKWDQYARVDAAERYANGRCRVASED